MGKKIQNYDQVNIEGTRQIIMAAQEAQVKRFVYVSSISVSRGTHSPNRVFSETLEPYLNPVNYSRSKLEGEHLCKTLCQEHGLEYVIVRPIMYMDQAVDHGVRRKLGQSLPYLFWEGCLLHSHR